jgi:hypothetical protein
VEIDERHGTFATAAAQPDDGIKGGERHIQIRWMCDDAVMAGANYPVDTVEASIAP